MLPCLRGGGGGIILNNKNHILLLWNQKTLKLPSESYLSLTDRHSHIWRMTSCLGLERGCLFFLMQNVFDKKTFPKVLCQRNLKPLIDCTAEDGGSTLALIWAGKVFELCDIIGPKPKSAFFVLIHHKLFLFLKQLKFCLYDKKDYGIMHKLVGVIAVTEISSSESAARPLRWQQVFSGQKRSCFIVSIHFFCQIKKLCWWQQNH